ncbi:Hypothetical predicted protein, partial [Pelobates cultripes]
MDEQGNRGTVLGCGPWGNLERGARLRVNKMTGARPLGDTEMDRAAGDQCGRGPAATGMETR